MVYYQCVTCSLWLTLALYIAHGPLSKCHLLPMVHLGTLYGEWSTITLHIDRVSRTAALNTSNCIEYGYTLQHCDSVQSAVEEVSVRLVIQLDSLFILRSKVR